MKRSFFGYLRAAFSAKPFGMFVAPNWIGLAAFGVLGLTNPGFWLVGAGLELAYLLGLASNGRFQRVIDRRATDGSEAEWKARMEAMVRRLTDTDQARYVAFVSRCRTILDQFAQQDPTGSTAKVQSENLSKLIWVYLRLLLARRAMSRVLKEPTLGETQEIEHRLAEVRARLADPAMGEDLRKSLSSQAEILEQRVAQRREGREKLDFLEAEILRIQEQVELLREQAALSTDADGLSARLDEITGSLGGASQWISDQQKLYGSLDDLLDEPPPAAARIAIREGR
ncbi:MAG: hypothetical protein IPI38_00265 [Gemmatimonadetes bacterium]|jgi:hypothetical protein|nr:hypothetical protein [Gemmatimonadota bacterium]MBP9200734.1 hypothetical protein [Gemmatimonadales bacterium]MBK7348285.1 hypothetical protein [Gemmatimonadota bacterium]MBK7713857.1 hypothetical protein [Gemmatimonadota bacterium]MBK7782910.1 hypothetical protein [Gemmatimonadota bacterium]